MVTATVIIPTHNRRQAIVRALSALTQQSYPSTDFEVIVVADGCSDDTIVCLHRHCQDYPFTLHILAQPGLGPAAARNAGANQANGAILIFMDDDIEPLPGFIAAHCAAHDVPRRVVIGYLPPRMAQQRGLFRHALHNWWETMFQRMGQPGYRFSYTDLLSGNFSLPRPLFFEVGAFNTSFTCHEDYELGVRLHKAEVEFIYAPAAKGYHHEVTDLHRSLQRKFQEGKADVALGELYPELRPTFLMDLLYHNALLPSRIMFLFAFYWPWLGDRLMRLVEMLLPIIEGIKLRGVWQRLVYGLLGYWYWRGVAQALPHWCALRRYLHEHPTLVAVPLQVDLADGLTDVQQEIDKKRPLALKICHGTTGIGIVPPQPGRERLRGLHLPHILRHDLKANTLRALAQTNVLNIPVDMETLIDECNQSIAS